MSNLTFRCSQDFIDTVKSAAKTRHLTMSDFVRTAVLHFMEDEGETQDNGQDNVSTKTIDVLQTQVDSLHQQLAQKDAQIDQLHQLVAMSQTNLGEVTRQLEDKRNGWWKRVFRRPQAYAQSN